MTQKWEAAGVWHWALGRHSGVHALGAFIIYAVAPLRCSAHVSGVCGVRVSFESRESRRWMIQLSSPLPLWLHPPQTLYRPTHSGFTPITCRPLARPTRVGTRLGPRATREGVPSSCTNRALGTRVRRRVHHGPQRCIVFGAALSAKAGETMGALTAEAAAR